MVTNDQARKIALFFLLAHADEKVALEAAHKAVSTFKALQLARGKSNGAVPSSKSPKSIKSEEVDAILAIRKTHQSLSGTLSKAQTRHADGDDETGSVLKASVDLSAWNKFRQDAAEVESTAVILSQILKFSEESIAAGLHISLGTARYRIGKGTRTLGAFLRQQSAKKGE
jgi:hypothetical protein